MRFPRLAAALVCGIALFCSGMPGQSMGDTWRLVQTQYHASGSYLGVYLFDVDPDRAAALKMSDVRGAEVARVIDDSPAEKAGIKVGDVLISYNGETILGREQLGRLVAETPPGRKVKCQLWRNGKMQTATILLAGAGIGNSVLPADNFRGLSMNDFPKMLMIWFNPALGVECEPIDSQLAQYFGVHTGILVRAVERGAPADKAGLHAGDVITAIGSHDIAVPHDLVSYLRSQQQPIKSIIIEFSRDHKPRSVTISLSE